MANKSLQETIRTAGGGLLETSEEEARTRGVITPLGLKSAGTGATPDQVKMAGTPAQKSGTLRQAIQEGDDLATQQRRSQTRKTATTEEQASIEQAAGLEGLDRLQALVQAESEKKIQAQLAAAQPTLTTADIQLKDPITEEDLPASSEMAPLLDTLINSQDLEETNTAQLELNRLLGRDGSLGKELLSAKEIKQGLGPQLGYTAEALATEFASAAEMLESDEIDFTELGFAEGLPQVESMLGLETGALRNMSIEEFTNKINSELDKEYSQVEDLQTVLNDAFASPAARASARAQLKELGAVGIRAAEGNIDQLAEALEGADTVTVLGQEMPLSDLLDNDYITGLVMKSLKDPEAMAKLAETEPELSAFIKRYEESFNGSI